MRNGQCGWLRGGPGDQVVLGTDSNDVLRGGSGNDLLCGFGGVDILRAGSGNDVLVGTEGTDTLVGNSGNDMLPGKEGETLRDSSGNDEAVIAESPADLSGRCHSQCARQQHWPL